MIILKGKSYRLRERGNGVRPLRLHRYATPPDRGHTASKPARWMHFSVPVVTRTPGTAAIRAPRRSYRPNRVTILPVSDRPTLLGEHSRNRYGVARSCVRR